MLKKKSTVPEIQPKAESLKNSNQSSQEMKALENKLALLNSIIEMKDDGIFRVQLLTILQEISKTLSQLPEEIKSLKSSLESYGLQTEEEQTNNETEEDDEDFDDEEDKED